MEVVRTFETSTLACGLRYYGFLYRWAFSELHSSLIRVWRIALYLRASYSTPLSLMERRNYSISLCEHREFVCHQRSIVL